jgi:hypothetical protein
VAFPRLFSLSNQKESKVIDFLELEGEIRYWSFSWRRNLFQWEEDQVVLLKHLLESVVFSLEDDCWWWIPEPDRTFSVKSSYKLLSKGLGSDAEVDEELKVVLGQIWNSAAPSKVIAFSWQLILDRIPSRLNLEVRGILSLNVPWECVGCVGKVETSNHLFLHCPSVMMVWGEIFKWVGVEIIIPPSLPSLFEMIKGSGRNSKIRSGLVLIWHSSIWAIWKARNRAIFADGFFISNEIVDNIKVLSWKWSLSRLKLAPCLYYEWCWNPGDCLLR